MLVMFAHNSLEVFFFLSSHFFYEFIHKKIHFCLWFFSAQELFYQKFVYKFFLLIGTLFCCKFLSMFCLHESLAYFLVQVSFCCTSLFHAQLFINFFCFFFVTFGCTYFLCFTNLFQHFFFSLFHIVAFSFWDSFSLCNEILKVVSYNSFDSCCFANVETTNHVLSCW
jgi:hypothetical protein